MKYVKNVVLLLLVVSLLFGAGFGSGWFSDRHTESYTLRDEAFKEKVEWQIWMLAENIYSLHL